MMKSIATFFLPLIFSLAVGCEMLDYFSKKSNVNTVSCLADMDAEGEAEKSDEGDEKTAVFDYLPVHTNQLTLPASVLVKNAQFSVTFIPSDYSTIIYSPPELL